MAGFQTPITIYQAIESIQNHKYLLPAFQREFEWTSKQIEDLFDSLMRNYPVGSMILWKISNKTRTDFNFFSFLRDYIEKHKIYGESYKALCKVFFAIIDGQQRLTGLYIGLCGTCSEHIKGKSWGNNRDSFPIRRLYLCVNKFNEDKDSDNYYLFKFLKDVDTKANELYTDPEGRSWFRVGTIIDLYLNDDFDVDDFCEKYKLDRQSKKTIRRLEKLVFTDLVINYFEIEEQDTDRAVSIFTRINSGGTNLSYSKILFSLTVGNWKTDARTEIMNLIEDIENLGFTISTDYVLKAFLYLHHKSIVTSIKSFSKEFCALIEENWQEIKKAIYSLFSLLQSYGFTQQTLTSYNATLPILYYLYASKKYDNFTTSVKFRDDRTIIRNWLLKILLRKSFSNHSDTTLTLARKVFSKDIEAVPLEKSFENFPAEELLLAIKSQLSQLTSEDIEALLETQKDNKYCFAILALLYPNLDYKNNNFHKDHIYSVDKYAELPEKVRAEYTWKMYNSIVNLQLLDANENEAKGNKLPQVWADEQLKLFTSKNVFYDRTHLPVIPLTLENFPQFYAIRKKILVNKLLNILR